MNAQTSNYHPHPRLTTPCSSSNTDDATAGQAAGLVEIHSLKAGEVEAAQFFGKPTMANQELTFLEGTCIYKNHQESINLDIFCCHVRYCKDYRRVAQISGVRDVLQCCLTTCDYMCNEVAVRRAGAERPWTNATGGHNWKDVKGCWDSLNNLWPSVASEPPPWSPCRMSPESPSPHGPKFGVNVSMYGFSFGPLVLWSFKPTWRGTFTQKRRSPTFKVAWILGERVLPTNITTSVEPSCVGSLLWAIGPQSLGIEASRCIIERERKGGRKIMIKIGSNKNIRLELSSRRTRWSSNLSEQKNQGHTFLFSAVWHWLLLRQVATLFSKSSNLRVQSFYWFLLGLHDDSIDTFIWWDHETSRVIDPGLCVCWSRGPRTKHGGFFQIAMVGLPQSINKNAISWPLRYPWPIDVFLNWRDKGAKKNAVITFLIKALGLLQ